MRIFALIWRSICSHSATKKSSESNLLRRAIPASRGDTHMRRIMSRDAYIHTSLPGAPGGPLMFLFHGTGGNENQLLGLALELVPGAAAVSPRGDVSEQGAARFFRRTGEGVYDMDDL